MFLICLICMSKKKHFKKPHIMNSTNLTKKIVVNNPSQPLLNLVEKMKQRKEETQKMLTEKAKIYFPKK